MVFLIDFYFKLISPLCHESVSEKARAHQYVSDQ